MTATLGRSADGARRVAVVGAGWAGLTAAVELVERRHRVTVFDMAPQSGGRARSLEHEGFVLDNGQHIMIGAYRDTLALMQRVGVDLDAAFLRRPLALVDPHGVGLVLPPGPPALAFARGVLGTRHWPLTTRFALLRTAARWQRQGFTCPDDASVATLTRHLPAAVRDQVFDPMCVAALNTPASEASGRVFLRVLKDALFGGRGASDLLLPRRPLAELLPRPAQQWLAARGTDVRLRCRVQALMAGRDGEARWLVDGEPFDAVVLACSASEAARLVQRHHEPWAQQAEGVRYQSIVTVYAQHDQATLARPMVALACDEARPAQFVFDLGALGQRRGLLAFVISGANAWLERGLDLTAGVTLAQACEAFAGAAWAGKLKAVHAIAERRATFACTPGLVRPDAAIAPGLAAAGDYVAGPYPATLEGAVRSAREAAHLATAGFTMHNAASP